MRYLRFKSLITVAAMLLLGARGVEATDGHFLHGVGAINSAMGGAGVAGGSDLLGTFYLNPAGLMAFPGNRMEFAFEMFKPDRTVSSEAGPFGAGSTRSKSEFVPIPVFGWSSMLGNGKVAIGLGGLAIGGFGVDYPVDPTNPILAPRPFGFGQIYTNYGLMKMTPSVAFAASEKLWLGASVNVGWATLSVDPMPAAAPDVDPGPDGQPFTQDDRAFYPSAAAADGSFGIGLQVGAIFHVNDLLSLGASYASRMDFQDFGYNATHMNPNLPNFGTDYRVTFALDVPAIASAGVALTALPNLRILGDARYIFYEDAAGFEGPGGFNEMGAVEGFGWENILVLALGAQLNVGEQLALRAGWNHADNPIPDELSMFNTPFPGIVKDHLTMGFGIKAGRRLGISAAYYHAFENGMDGPMYGPTGPISGSSVANSLKEDGFLVQFSVGTRGEIF